MSTKLTKEKDQNKRKFWNLQTDLISTPTFFNNLPSAPSGPFFKSVELKNYEKFAKYKISTLEKSHIWQPHLPGAGVKLDLVDQEAVLTPSVQPPIDPRDLKYLEAGESHGASHKKRKIASEKPWWLRNTVYLENNLYNQRRPAVVEKIVDKAALRSLALSRDPMTEEVAEESFRKVLNSSAYTDALRKNKPGRKDASVTIEWAVPLVPDLGLLGSSGVPAVLPARFEEDLDTLFEKKSRDDCHGLASRSTYDPRRALLTNARRHNAGTSQGSVGNKALNISVVAPATADENEDGGTRETLYNWIADFKLEVGALGTHGMEEFLVLARGVSVTGVNGHNDISSRSSGQKNGLSGNSGGGENDQYVRYFPVRSRAEVKKLPVDEWAPHECVVTRVSLGPGSAR